MMYHTEQTNALHVLYICPWGKEGGQGGTCAPLD